MLETVEKTNELKTLAVQKDTWILEVPPEVCKNEGFADGTLISLTLKNDSISGVYLKPKEDEDVAKLKENEYFER